MGSKSKIAEDILAISPTKLCCFKELRENGKRTRKFNTT